MKTDHDKVDVDEATSDEDEVSFALFAPIRAKVSIVVGSEGDKKIVMIPDVDGGGRDLEHGNEVWIIPPLWTPDEPERLDLEVFLDPLLKAWLLQAAKDTFIQFDFAEATCPYHMSMAGWYALVKIAIDDLEGDEEPKLRMLPYDDEDVYCLPEDYDEHVEAINRGDD